MTAHVSTAHYPLPPRRSQNPAADPGARWGKASAPRREWLAWWHARADECAQAGPAYRLAAKQGFVLTTTQARACGVNRAEVRRLLRRGTWWTPRWGVLALVAIPEPAAGDDQAARLAQRRRLALACAAAALANPGQVISGNAGATLHGLPVFREPSAPQLTAAPPTTPGNRSSMLVRPAGLASDEVSSWFGAPVTTVARTVVDLARHSRRDGLMAADAALFANALTASGLDAALARARGWPGIRRARRVLELATPKAESPLESLTRLALHDCGLPLPEPQAEIYDPRRGMTYRVDGLWPSPTRGGKPVVLEVDGRIKYGPDGSWDEKRRQERLERLGYTVIRLMWSDIVTDWDETYERIVHALGLRAVPPPMM